MRQSRLLLYSALFSFFVTYTAIWAILEPFPICPKYEMLRWWLLVGISTVLVVFGLIKKGFMSYLFYRYVRPYFINKLQVLGTGHSNDSLHEGWKSVHENTPMYPKIKEDPLFGKVYRFEDQYTHDAIHGIKVSAKEKGTKIDYFLKPISENSEENPAIYVLVQVRNIAEGIVEKNEAKWLTFVIDKVHNTETFKHSEMEEIIYISSKATFMGWMYFSLDIEETVKKIRRWENTYAFNKIDGIKTRGSFEMASIMIYH